MLLALALLATLAPPPNAALAPPPLPDQPMTIQCTGDGDRRMGQDSPFADREAHFDGAVTLELDGKGGARLRVPDALIPRIHGGGKDGWWTAKLERANQAEVAGTVSFNFFDKARFVIDLGVGVGQVDDNLGRFVGRCRVGG